MSATPRSALSSAFLLLFLSCALLVTPPTLAKGIQTASGYVAGRQLSSVVTADFNGDGRPDVLVIESLNSAPDTIHVLLTNADGTLGASIPTSGAGLNLSGVVVGDFNKDGKMDIAVVDSGDIMPDPGANTLTVFLGNGDGTFTLKATYPTGSRPMGLAAVDANNDGQLDLVVVNANDNTISSFLGAAGGTFVLAGTFSTGSIPATSIAAGNLDHDGKPDLVVGSQNSNQFGLLPGLGNGSFASIRLGLYASVNPSGGVAIADMNGDGNPDLVFSGNPVSYYRSNGNLTFQTPVTLDTGGRGGESVSIADLNGDGHPDVVVSKTNSGDVSVILSDGHGGFLTPKYYAAVIFPAGATVADLHGDHKLDVITVSSIGGNNVQVIRGNGDGSLQGAFSYDFQSNDIAASQAIADFNGDGLPDIAVMNASGELGVLLNTGSYSFSVIPPVNYGFEAGNVSAADVNQDGKMDVLISAASHISLLLGKGDGTFQAPIAIDVPNFSFPIHAVAVGDFNGDGKSDIAFSGATPELTPGAGSTTFGILFGNGDGTFQPLQNQDTYSLTQLITGVVAADLNGDHKLDIVAIGGSSVGIYLNNGNGIFTTGNVYPLTWFSRDANAVVVDIRGNGTRDILVSKVDANNPKLTILLGNGNGTFSTSTLPLHRFISFNGALAAGDFDGDGKMDVAVQEIGYLEIFPGLGNGSFAAPILHQSSASPIMATDMAGGGFPDLVGIGTYPMIIPNTGGSHISIASNANPAVYGQTVTLSATVHPMLPGAPSATGTVSISDGNTVLGALPLNSQTASLPTTFAVGTHPIHVQFSGDDNLFARSSSVVSQVVNKASTTIVLASSSASVVVGRQIGLGASVTSAIAGALSGVATLHDGASVISSSQVDAGGQATFGAFVLSAGHHSITVTYGGDPNYASGSSVTYSIDVLDFNLSTPRAARPSRTGTAGSARQSFRVQLTATGGEISSVHLTCPNLPLGFTCRFDQQDFSLNGPRVIEGTLVQGGRAARVSAIRGPIKSVEVSATAGPLQRTVTVSLP